LATSRKFKQIRSSIAEVGLIEPLTVSALDAEGGRYVLLDGHMRLIALRELGRKEAPCLLAVDDEAYTYNNRINRLSSIQEHLMLRRAIERGVSPQRLASALNVDVSHIQKKMNLLDGICPEAAELLTDRQFSAELSRVIRKMKPTRQVECVELLLSANNLTVAYAEALLAATPAEFLVEGNKPKKLRGVTKEQMPCQHGELGKDSVAQGVGWTHQAQRVKRLGRLLDYRVFAERDLHSYFRAQAKPGRCRQSIAAHPALLAQRGLFTSTDTLVSSA